MKRTAVLVCSLVFLAPVATVPCHADWTGLASPDFTYCYATDPCDYEITVEDWELGLQADCSARVDILGENPAYQCGAGSLTEVSSVREWDISGLERDNSVDPFNIELTATGQRTGAGTYLIEGARSALGRSVLEVSLFRYAGDPSAFEGLAPTSVSDLVEWGVIDADDVLLAELLPDEALPDRGYAFSFEVDVTGIPDEEIVLMQNGRAIPSPPVVPATGSLAAAALALILLALGTAIALSRRRASVR